MQVDSMPSTLDISPSDTTSNGTYHSNHIVRPSSAVPIRPFAHPPPETSVGIASTVPYVPVASNAANREFGYIQKRLRKTSMDVGPMVHFQPNL
jgi:hypothetical protein